MIQGLWSAPLTKSGRSVLVPPGPWSYGLTGIGVYYNADPNDLRSVVPKPLDVSAGGEVFAYLVEIVSWSPKAPEFNIEAPDLVQYSEAAFFIKVKHNNTYYAYCPFMWVDKDLPLLRGLLVGWPKKLANIAITRLHPLLEGLDTPRKGLKLGGYASRAGYTLFKLRITIEDENIVDKIPLENMGEMLIPRYFPGITPELSTVNELIALRLKSKTKAWTGTGEIEIIGGFNDELECFKPVNTSIKGYYFHMLLEPKTINNIGRIEGFS